MPKSAIDNIRWRNILKPVRFSQTSFLMNMDDYETQLECPGCESDYLHHLLVEFHGSHNESASAEVPPISVSETRVGSRMVTPLGEFGGEGRRNSIAILFHCEMCWLISVLAIIQHKGNTIFRWIATSEKPQDRDVACETLGHF